MTGFVFRTAAIVALFVTAVCGQNLQFGVASIHPSAEHGGLGEVAPSVTGGPGTSDPGRIAYARMPLLALITLAFETPASHITGSQAGLQDGYNITATVPPGATKKDVPAMLRALLSERFELKTHTEQKTKGIYRLVVAKGGIKFHETHLEPSDATSSGAPDKDGYPILAPNFSGIIARPSSGHLLLRGQNATMADLIRWLTPQLGRDLVDGTALTGKYDLKFVLPSSSAGASPAGRQDASDPGDSVFDTLSMLGLRAESVNDSVNFVVIDSIRKEPTPN